MRLLHSLTLAALAFACCGAGPPANGVPRVAIETTAGTIVVQLDAKRAPKTTANFLHYVDAHFYDGGSFFRAIPGFVIQGGNQKRERPTDPAIELETPFRTGIRNTDGAIAMARTFDPNSAKNEFYIDDGAQPRLDGGPDTPGYAAFGHVIRGMDVVRAIARLPAQNQLLTTPVTITRIHRVSS